MTDHVLHPSLELARVGFRYVDNTGITRGAYNGVVQSTNYGGDRVAASLQFNGHGGASATARARRRQLLAQIMRMQGRQNRIYIADPGYTPGGSFPTSELLANSDFSGGTASWNPGSEAVLSVADSMLRVKRSANTGGGAAYVGQSVAGATNFAPHCLRFFVSAVRGAASINATAIAGTLFATYDSSDANPGYRRALTFPVGTHNVFADNQGASISLAGDYYDLSFGSYARCLVADGGGNRLLEASTITVGSWTKTNATPSAVGGTGPDGVANAQALTENSSGGSHAVTQSGTRTAGAAWVCGYGDFKRRTGTRDLRMFAGNNGTDCAAASFDLSSGAISSISNAGATTGAQAFVVNLGNGWFRCIVIGYCPSASTIFLQANMTSGGLTSYTGDGTSSLYMRMLGAYPSAVPTRGTLTTTVAIDAATQSGSKIYVKGLPVSTSALLLPGDWVEIDGQLKMVTASLDSDAGGAGELQISPPLRRAIADNMPIIVHRPMGRFVLAGDAEWMNEPGIVSTAALDFEEAYS